MLFSDDRLRLLWVDNHPELAAKIAAKLAQTTETTNYNFVGVNPAAGTDATRNVDGIVFIVANASDVREQLQNWQKVRTQKMRPAQLPVWIVAAQGQLELNVKTNEPAFGSWLVYTDTSADPDVNTGAIQASWSRFYHAARKYKHTPSPSAVVPLFTTLAILIGMVAAGLGFWWWNQPAPYQELAERIQKILAQEVGPPPQRYAFRGLTDRQEAWQEILENPDFAQLPESAKATAKSHAQALVQYQTLKDRWSNLTPPLRCTRQEELTATQTALFELQKELKKLPEANGSELSGKISRALKEINQLEDRLTGQRKAWEQLNESIRTLSYLGDFPADWRDKYQKIQSQWDLLTQPQYDVYTKSAQGLREVQNLRNSTEKSYLRLNELLVMATALGLIPETTKSQAVFVASPAELAGGTTLNIFAEKQKQWLEIGRDIRLANLPEKYQTILQSRWDRLHEEYLRAGRKRILAMTEGKWPDTRDSYEALLKKTSADPFFTWLAAFEAVTDTNPNSFEELKIFFDKRSFTLAIQQLSVWIPDSAGESPLRVSGVLQLQIQKGESVSKFEMNMTNEGTRERNGFRYIWSSKENYTVTFEPGDKVTLRVQAKAGDKKGLLAWIQTRSNAYSWDVLWNAPVLLTEIESKPRTISGVEVKTEAGSWPKLPRLFPVPGNN